MDGMNQTDKPEVRRVLHFYNEKGDHMWDFELGDKLKCTVTGFVGIATARIEYLNGCRQYCIKPPVNKEGKIIEGEYIDESQLKLIETSTAKKKKLRVPVPTRRAGGPAQDAPPPNYRG